MPRILAFDAGMNIGWGALGDGRPVASGWRRLGGGPRSMGVTGLDCEDYVRKVIRQERPAVIGFATPFVGSIVARPTKFINGKPVWGSGFATIPPDNIRPLFGCLTVVEMVVERINRDRRRRSRAEIRCIEVNEPAAKRAFLTAVPGGSAKQKKAIQRACSLRRWPWASEHAADALCIASYLLGMVAPAEAHKTTPLFLAATRQ